jgi:hypothetical protein
MPERLLRLLAAVAAVLGLGAQIASAAAPGADPGIDRALAAQEAFTDRLLDKGGVVGTAVGVSAEGEPVVRILVAHSGVAGLPNRLNGVPVEVDVTGPLFAVQRPPGAGNGGGGGGGGTSEPATTARWPRPVPIGISTGNAGECSAGTIGARLKAANGDVFALSNNHVYALSNAAPLGSDIRQPGRYDTACADSPDNALGTLADFETLRFDGTNNVMDAAIAATTADDLRTTTPAAGYGSPRAGHGVAATLGMDVQKFGRTTRLTRGDVTGLNATVNIGYPGGTARFVGQIIVDGKGFLKSGDSGSLLVTDPGRQAVGLLFASTMSGRTAIANPIGAVLDRFVLEIDGD